MRPRSWKLQPVSMYTDPYQPTSERQWKSSVMRRMAVPMMLRSRAVWTGKRMRRGGRVVVVVVEGGFGIGVGLFDVDVGRVCVLPGLYVWW